MGGIPDYDLELFNEWRKQAVAYAGDKLPESPLECLAYAQHYGLATRLLDWSVKPLVALFFAVEESGPLPGVVYCHAQMNVLDGESKKLPNVFGFYRPRPFDRRILAQGGAFTYHPDPMAAFPVVEAASMYENDPKPFWNLVALEIPAHVKAAILSQLCDLGVTRVALFPDLDGLSSFINWGARVEAAELRKHFSNGGV